MLSNRVKKLLTKIVTFSIICSALNILLFNDKNIFLNITIFILYIVMGGVIQYELISMLKQYKGTNPKKYKIQTILASIVLWVIIWTLSSRDFYMIF